MASIQNYYSRSLVTIKYFHLLPLGTETRPSSTISSFIYLFIYLFTTTLVGSISMILIIGAGLAPERLACPYDMSPHIIKSLKYIYIYLLHHFPFT